MFNTSSVRIANIKPVNNTGSDCEQFINRLSPVTQDEKMELYFLEKYQNVVIKIFKTREKEIRKDCNRYIEDFIFRVLPKSCLTFQIELVDYFDELKEMFYMFFEDLYMNRLVDYIENFNGIRDASNCIKVPDKITYNDDEAKLFGCKNHMYVIMNRMLPFFLIFVKNNVSDVNKCSFMTELNRFICERVVGNYYCLLDCDKYYEDYTKITLEQEDYNFRYKNNKYFCQFRGHTYNCNFMLTNHEPVWAKV